MTTEKQAINYHSQHPLVRLARPLTAPAILLLAAILRFYRLSGQSLWADEGNSVALARRSFVEIARRTAFDIHPPFYYWLLKIWISIFGDSEIGLRSLSVVLGILLVFLIGVLGTRLFSSRVGLIAAFIAALSPFQVYYSQEARMYMLLTVLGSLTMLITLIILKDYSGDKSSTGIGIIYVLIVTAGLYTHYAYPIILLTVNLVALLWFWQARSHISTLSKRILNWLILQAIPILLYLPWLPTAWRQLTTWPSAQQDAALGAILGTVSTTLLFGLSWPFEQGFLAVGILALTLVTTLWLGLKKDWQDTIRATQSNSIASPTVRLILLWLWFLLPVGLTIVIFSPAFLKFLLVAAPPLALLLALVSGWLAFTLSPSEKSAENPARFTLAGYLISSALLIVVTGASTVSLHHYYNDPTYVRDNYRGIANFIQAVGGLEDAVILNAEGQQDVFNYYYERAQTAEAPVFPLPHQRPLDEATTLVELERIAENANKIYAVYWATQQADPDGFIEGWLDNNLFKATDQWYGNVRLVSYASPPTDLDPLPVNYRLGDSIRLTAYGLSSTQIAPGDILQVALNWETDTPQLADYTVFVQVLDPRNHLVGQRDAQPIVPTTEWKPGKTVIDGHGVYIEPGTPPGKHRLVAGLYNSATGQRIPVATGAEGESPKDFVELGEIEVVRPPVPLPLEAFDIQVPLNAPMLEVTLLGYDLYKLGHRSTPDTPLHPGDPLHLVVYWRSDQPIYWLEDQLFIQVVTVSGRKGLQSFTRQPSGSVYSIKDWQPGEIVRAQYDFFLNNLEPGTYRLALTLGVRQSSMQQVVALTNPFRVE
jgi:uncharacterized membrane protein